MAKDNLLLTKQQEEYLAWLLTPDEQRQPRYKKGYAEEHGLHINTLGLWEKKKPFIDRWKLGLEGLNQSPERTQKLLDSLYTKGIAGDTKSAELYLKATGNMPNASTLNIKTETSLREISDEELETMILELSQKQVKKNSSSATFPMTITEA